MNVDLRIFTAISLLVMFGCASAESVNTHRDSTRVLPVAEPDGGAELREAAKGDASGAQSPVKLARVARKTSTASAEHVAPGAGERRATSGRRLTLRQKRLFVLGLTTQENK